MCVGITTHRYKEIARNINCLTFGFWLRMISLKKSFSACWLSVERINFIYSLKTVRQTSVNKRSRAENSRLVWWGLLWIIEIKEREKKGKETLRKLNLDFLLLRMAECFQWLSLQSAPCLISIWNWIQRPSDNLLD